MITPFFKDLFKSYDIFDLKIVNNILVLIRLVFFYLIFLFIYIADKKPQVTNEIIFLAVVIGLFSIIVFFLNSVFSSKITFYIQSVFDSLMISYLIYSSGFVESPYIIFFAFIIGYLSVIRGAFAGLIGILEFFLSIGLIYTVSSKFLNFKINILSGQIQYFFAFFLIYILATFLHYSYGKRVKELKQLENIHSLIVKNIGIGIILLDKSKKVLSCNDAGLKILEVSSNKLIGKYLRDMGFIIKKEEDIIKYKGKFIGYKIQSFYDESNLLLGELLIFQDVTEKEMLKMELEKKQKLATLGQFATIIAHEIKNPLGAIKGSIQLVKKQIKSDKLINIIEREINRLNVILNNLLFVGKPARKDLSKIDMTSFLKDFITYFQVYEIYDELNILYEPKENFEVLIPENELRQILWNLVINSYEAKPDATVNIVTDIINGKKTLIYTDNGSGISKEISNEVFKPFYTTKKTGSGLGLYVIYLICEKNNIQFRLFSNEEFEGFKIEFYFN